MPGGHVTPPERTLLPCSKQVRQRLRLGNPLHRYSFAYHKVRQQQPLQVFTDDEDLVRDTTAAQLRKGKDVQGIPWELTQYTRPAYRVGRAGRLNQIHVFIKREGLGQGCRRGAEVGQPGCGPS